MEGENKLETLYREGRLIRNSWESEDEQGRELLCVLTGLAGAGTRPDTCPVSIAPAWVAHLLPWLDDAPSDAEWPRIIERLIPLAPHLHKLTRRCEYLVREACVREAMRHTTDAAVLEVCERVAALCLRAAQGEEIKEEFTAAEAWAAWAARAAAAEAAWSAEEAAEEAARAAAAAAVAAGDRLANRILDLFEQDLEGNR